VRDQRALERDHGAAPCQRVGDVRAQPHLGWCRRHVLATAHNP
jgi:hypothetical protein